MTYIEPRHTELTRDLEATGRGYLSLDGTSGCNATSPDSESLDVQRDIEVVARVQFDDWTPAATNRVILAKYETSTNNRSYLFRINTNGDMAFRFTQDGVNELADASTASISVANNTTLWLKWTHDVDNGAGGRTSAFYTAPDSPNEPSSWTQLGTDVTSASTVRMFSGTSPLVIGTDNQGAGGVTGKIYRVIIRKIIGGSTAAFDMDFTLVPRGETVMHDYTKAGVTLQGSAVIAQA